MYIHAGHTLEFWDTHEYTFSHIRLRSGKIAFLGNEFLEEGIQGTLQLEQQEVLGV